MWWLRVLSWCCRLIPWPVLYLLAAGGGLIGMAFRWRRIVLANVQHACYLSPPSAPLRWYLGMQQITSHCKTVISLLRAGEGERASRNDLHAENWQEIQPYLGRRGIVIVAPHAGPYTVLGLLIMPWLRERGLRGPPAVVVRTTKFLGSDAPMQWLSERVTRAGVIVVPADGPPSQIASTLRTVLRAHGIVVLFVDEPSTAPSCLMPFFDSAIRLPTGPARLARATNSVIIPCIVTYGRSRMSHLRFDRAIEPSASASVGELLGRIASSLEGFVRQHVDQWSMLTPIWQTSQVPPPEGYSYADLHLHTPASDGFCEVRDWVSAASAAGIAVIGVMDHDTTAAIRAWRVEEDTLLSSECHVLAGAEITARGRIVHVGVLFGGDIPEKLPPPGTPIVEIVRWARTIEDSAVILVHPQPFLWRAQLAALKRAGALPDAIETRFPLMGRRTEKLEAVATEYGLATLGGTDAHLSPTQLGRHVTMFPGRDVQDLLRAIREGTTQAVSRPVAARVPPSLYVLQCAYSWLLPFAVRSHVATVRTGLLRLAQRRARVSRL